MLLFNNLSLFLVNTHRKWIMHLQWAFNYIAVNSKYEICICWRIKTTQTSPWHLFLGFALSFYVTREFNNKIGDQTKCTELSIVEITLHKDHAQLPWDKHLHMYFNTVCVCGCVWFFTEVGQSLSEGKLFGWNALQHPPRDRHRNSTRNISGFLVFCLKTCVWNPTLSRKI